MISDINVTVSSYYYKIILYFCLFSIFKDRETIVIIGDGTEIRKYDATNQKYEDLVELHTGHIDGMDFHAKDPEDGKFNEEKVVFSKKFQSLA